MRGYRPAHLQSPFDSDRIAEALHGDFQAGVCILSRTLSGAGRPTRSRRDGAVFLRI